MSTTGQTGIPPASGTHTGRGKLRLFCFPYGGAGGSVYRSWPALVPPDIEVCLVQFPGRETRYREAPLTRIELLVEDLVRGFDSAPKSPFAFFGHSIGALVAFELARELRRRGAIGPLLLALSGYPAPHLTRDRPRVSHLPKQELLHILNAEFDISDEVRAHPDLLDLVLPILRTDIEAVETYKYRAGPPLDSQIVVFGGSEDREARAAQLPAWAEHTRLPCRLHMFQGGHFFLNTSRTEVIATLVAALREALPPAA